MRFIQLTDLHISAEPNSPTAAALHWAARCINGIKANFVVASGDITTYGSAESAQLFLQILKEAQTPVYFSPGNAEHRSQGAMSVLNQSSLRQQQRLFLDGILFLFPDTSRGEISQKERDNQQIAVSHHANRESCVMITHYPLDALEPDSGMWLHQFLQDNQINCLIAGHKHLHRTRKIGNCTEIVTRGLDPDKASGDLPGLSLFEHKGKGEWTETFLPWEFPVRMHPFDTESGTSHIGWSIRGNPIDTIEESRKFSLSCLEVRPTDLDFSMDAVKAELSTLRSEGDTYISWHLPSLSYDGEMRGETILHEHIQRALDINIDHFTVHVPEIPAYQMQQADIWDPFEEAFDRLFRTSVSQGVRLAIENVHNQSGVRPTDPTCKFATDIDTYLQWITAIKDEFSDIPHAQVGAHFDVGHGRNNGEFGNMHPLGDWYTRVGKHILGYHIHQIRNDANSGKLTNHREMFTPFDQRISYAGFIYAWSTGLINRAPLFVEIRNAEERRRSTRRLLNFFERAKEIRSSLELTPQ